MTERKFGL